MVSNVSSTLSQPLFTQQRQALFQKADTDGSGALSLDEFSAAGPKDTQKSQNGPSAADLFKQIDTDGDGQVTSTELDANAKQAFEQRLQQGGGTQVNAQDFAQNLISKADSDGNGSLNLDEFSAAKPKDAPSDAPSSQDIFKSLDSDGNGQLTSAELEAGAQKGGPGGAGGPPAGGPPPGGAGGSNSAGGSGSASGDDSLSVADQALDTNHDGTVSAKERLAGLLDSGSSAADNINSLISKTLKTLLSAQENSFA